MYLMGLKKVIEKNEYPSYGNFRINPGEYTIEFEPSGLNYKGENGEVRKYYLNKTLEKKDNIPVIFEKDDSNPFDKNAVKIYIETESGEKIDCGFVPEYPKIGEKAEYFNQWFYRNLDKFKQPVLTYDSLSNNYTLVCELKDEYKEERDKIEYEQEMKYLDSLYRQWKEEGLPPNYGDYIDNNYSSSYGYSSYTTIPHQQKENEGCLIGFFKLNWWFMEFILILALIKLAIVAAPLLIFLGLIFFFFFRKK